jgi:hypothetical protein
MFYPYTQTETVVYVLARHGNRKHKEKKVHSMAVTKDFISYVQNGK